MAQIVAIQGDLVRAVEIGATAHASSRWEKSLTGRMAFVEPLLRLTQDFAPRGCGCGPGKRPTRDLFETAAKLLAGLQEGQWLGENTDRLLRSL